MTPSLVIADVSITQLTMFAGDKTGRCHKLHCCMQDQHCPADLACAGVTTMEGGGGLTGAAAGMVGGVIGMLLVLVVLFVVAGIIFSVTYYRKKKMNK